MRDTILKAIDERADASRVYVTAGVLRELGRLNDITDIEEVLCDVPYDRPVPVLICDLKKLLGEKDDGEEPGEE